MQWPIVVLIALLHKLWIDELRNEFILQLILILLLSLVAVRIWGFFEKFYIEKYRKINGIRKLAECITREELWDKLQ